MNIQNGGQTCDSAPTSFSPAAKRIKLDQKLVDICSNIKSKLTLSSPTITVPGTTRTAVAASSPQPKPSPSFDFLFVANDNEIRQMLSAMTQADHTGDGKRETIIISHPDDLSQANLVSRLTISEDGHHRLQPGKLFEGSQPLTLLIDIRKLTSEELPKFNDLLDPDAPCLYDKVSQKKRPLGKHVTLRVVAHPDQLASVGQSDDAPGADFWRRINRPVNTWQFNTRTDNTDSMDTDDVPPVLAEFPDTEVTSESPMDDGNTVLIDCHLHGNWRHLLFGGPGVDKHGRIQHIKGRLEQLKAGQRVILKGTNWQDLAFEQTIRQLISHQCFESNGVICQLPNDVQFYQMPLRHDELHALFQTMTTYGAEDRTGHASQNPIIINQSNITQWLNLIAIVPQGYAVPNSSLLEQVQAGGVPTVTSPLNETQWFHLLGALQTIRKTAGIEPQLQVVHTKQQPEALGLGESDHCSLLSHTYQQKKNADHASVNSVIYQQQAQANHWINRHPEAPLVIQVHDQTTFSQLFDNIHITSERQAHFGRHQSPLQTALSTGKHVVLRGLESNPALQQLLEPLVCGQPLLINGQLQAYPKARISVLWPDRIRSPSPLWHSAITNGETCLGMDIWDINAINHDILRNKLPELAINQLYEAFSTVPAHLCNPLPEMSEGLLNNLILAARRAQKADQAPQLQPCHWRKAINSVLTHGTRQNPSVRDFMKVACYQLLPDVEQHTDGEPIVWVDPDQLNAVINNARSLNREFVEKHIWQLARAFAPSVFKDTGFKQWPLYYERAIPWRSGRNECLNRLCALIVAHVPEKQRSAVAYQLAIDPTETKPCESLTIRPSNQIKRLEDALSSGWQLKVEPNQTRRDVIHSLASNCFEILRSERVTENRETECIEHIENRLAESLEWQGSTDKPLSALAHDLYHGLMHQKDKENRRLSRLHDRLSDSPVIFLQGETGTGKSYFSATMAKAAGQTSVVSLGPSDSEQTLMKRWQWHEKDDDRYMVQQNRALMEWANTLPDNDGHYVTLVLDEANLAKTGLLASLNGLWEPEPCIYVNGHPVKVSPQHRVILTGNPDHYAGRQLDPALKEKLPSAYYPALNWAFLKDRVVEPTLTSQLQRHLPEHQMNDMVRSAAESVMALWQFYPELLPDHEFTPRDLTDICSWVGWYLDRALPDVHTRDSITPEKLNGLILQSFRDVLAAEVTEAHQDSLSALEYWFSARYPVDNTLRDNVHSHALLDIRQSFRAVTAQCRPDFDTSGSAVSELVQRLGQDLSRCQQAYHLNRKHGGRQATLIQGPAGRGKDATLNLVINSVKRQAEQRRESMPAVFSLNACDCTWDTLCETIQRAKIHGGIVVISEMNLIDSQHLEGELNDILAGDAHPGFHLFATINPPEYSGRKPLSPALKGRFRHLPIRQYNPAELQAIAEKVLPQSTQGKRIAEQLTQQHCRLRAYLQQKNLPLQPTSLDLQNVARAVINSGDLTENGLSQWIHQHYRLYLMAANISLEKFPEPLTLSTGKRELDPALCDWFNRKVSGIDRPWLICRSDLNSINEERHEIQIKAYLNEAEARTEIIKMVAQANWLASGLSLKPDESDDILTQALYRHWQHCWFSHRFGQISEDVNTLFPLTEEQEKTLKIPENLPYIKEADRLISAWDFNAVQLWPAFWLQLSQRTLKPVSQYSQEAEPTPHQQKTQTKARYELAELPRAITRTLDTDTAYEHREELPQITLKQIFNDHTSPIMYRLRVFDITLDCQGNVEERRFGRGEYGLEAVFPAVLPEGEVTLSHNQNLGVEWVCNRKNTYLYLPGLNPHEAICALRITPEMTYRVLKDRYTSLHMIYLPDASDNQTVKIDYVVENKKPKHTPEEPLRLLRQAVGDRPDCELSKSMRFELISFFTHFETSHMPEDQKDQVRAIQLAETQESRVAAIAKYCGSFAGKYRHKSQRDYFRFLLWNKQGACRHRTPVFVALCRYFGIPARTIKNAYHVFPEYSLDSGISWIAKDLRGAPANITESTHNFQPTRQGSGSSSKLKKIKDLFNDADLAQQQGLAKAYGMSPKEMHKLLESGCALPKIGLSDAQIIRNFWDEKSLSGFSLGVSMIESIETKALGYAEKALIGRVKYDGWNTYKPMVEGVKGILSNSNEDQVTQPLKSLHSKMVAQGGAYSHEWVSSIVNILKNSDLTNPSVIHFAHEVFKEGWLDPLPTYYDHIMSTNEHHDLLVRMEGIHELKGQASICLKKWYQELLSKGKNSQEWRRVYQGNDKEPSFITHSHDGTSTFLSEKITSTSLQTSWTDDPEGIPDIERMLVHNPAFPQFVAGKMNHRPVIIVGRPSWRNAEIDQKVQELFQRKVESSPKLKNVDNLKARYKQAIQQAFSHYLYKVTNSKGGRLTHCWINAELGDNNPYSRYHGSHSPSSPEELCAMLSKIRCDDYWLKNSLKDTYLRQAQNASNALVLKSDDLTTIAKEFVDNVNLSSIYDSLDA